MSPRVFVVQESRYTQGDGSRVSHDYTSLHRYGTVHFLLPQSRKPLEESGRTELDILVEKLSDFRPVEDYIVFSGDPILCAMAAMCLYSATPADVSEVQALKWDRKAGVYEPVPLYVPVEGV